jgi:hypothetical protein
MANVAASNLHSCELFTDSRQLQMLNLTGNPCLNTPEKVMAL